MSIFKHHPDTPVLLPPCNVTRTQKRTEDRQRDASLHLKPNSKTRYKGVASAKQNSPGSFGVLGLRVCDGFAYAIHSFFPRPNTNGLQAAFHGNPGSLEDIRPDISEQTSPTSPSSL